MNSTIQRTVNERTPTMDTTADLYLNLLIGCLTRTVIREEYSSFKKPTRLLSRWTYPYLKRVLGRRSLFIMERVDHTKRVDGRDWPQEAETMIGLKRLENIKECIKAVIADKVPGDFAE